MRTIIATITKGKLPALPWTPTSYVTNGTVTPPAGLPVTVIPIDPMVKGHPGVLQNDWRLVMNADALFLDGYNDHLYKCARKYGLTIYAPLYDEADDENLFASMTDSAPPPDDDLFGGSAEPDLFGGSTEDVDLFA